MAVARARLGGPALRLARNFALLSGAETVSKGLAAAAFAYLARVLGPAGYGDLEFALAVLVFLTLFVDWGLSPLSARESARDRGLVLRLVPHVVALRLGLAGVAFAAVALLLALTATAGPIRPLLLLYGLTLFGVPWLLQSLFQGRDLMHFVALASVLRYATFAGSVFLFVRGPAQVWMVPIAEGIAVAATGAYWVLMVRRSFGHPRLVVDPRFALATARQALPIGASELVWTGKMYAGTVLLGLLVSDIEVARLAAALRLIVALHTFVFLYFFNLLPSLSRAAETSGESLARLLYPSMKLAAWLAVFVGVLGTVLAEPVLLLLYGDQYRGSVVPLQVLIWFLPLALMSGHYRYALIAAGKQSLEFLAAAGGLGVGLALNLALIPALGALGAAIALVASEVAIWAIAYAFVRRSVAAVSPWGLLPRPLLAGLLLAAAVYLVRPPNLWIAAAAGAVFYGSIVSILQPQVFGSLRGILVAARA